VDANRANKKSKKRHHHVTFLLYVSGHSKFLMTQMSKKLTDGRVILLFPLIKEVYITSSAENVCGVQTYK
jgi:hypothetical protein